jgi:hypothetical protein
MYFAHNGHVYLHDMPEAESIRLDVAQGVTEPSEGNAKFLFASSDGARLLFTDPEQLLPGAAGGGVYECRIVESPHATHCELALTALRAVDLTTQSLIGGSQDGSRLYFLVGDRLETASYESGTWVTREGPLVGKDTVVAVEAKGPEHSSNYRVSANGDFFTFMSDEDLTGYDTRDAVSGALDQEVYLYEAGANRLVCASCDPTGGRPVGVPYEGRALAAGDNELQYADGTIAANLPPWTQSNKHYFLYQPRYLSSSGRLFFDSVGPLVPQDVSGTEDVYEYEPTGVGNCEVTSATYSERSGGCVNLISSGSSPE